LGTQIRPLDKTNYNREAQIQTAVTSWPRDESPNEGDIKKD